jgi:4-amino-4-deoxy-L-arabinose transferase-like glycosyltransferase
VGWIAAALFLGNPIVVSLAGSGYVEAGLTLFATAALDSARRFRRTGERGWLVLAAVFGGTAADVKYLGLFFLGMAALAIVLSSRPLASRVRDLLLFGAVAAAVVVPWYGRMFVHTGNPLFPFFPQLFGSTPWNPLRFHSFAAGGVLRRLATLARLPWDVVFARERYGFQPPFSPVWLVLLPGAALAAFRDSRLRRLLGVAVLYAFACLFLPPDSRYFVPVLPLVSLAAAGALVPWLGRLPFRREALAWGLSAVFLLPGWAYGGYRIYRQGPIPLTPEAREAYLARRLPLYRAVAFLNRTRGNGYTVWGLDTENMVYHARGRLLGDWIGTASFPRVLGGLHGPADLHRRLRNLGAGYLLIPAEDKEGGVDMPFPEDAAFRRWFRPVYADPHARVYALAREER